jgi:ATP-dependent helicase/nuclease subunit B
MKPFLFQIAEQLIEKHRDDLRDVIIVVPGKRAGLFLRKHLAKILGKSFFAPEILTLPDFIAKLSDKRTTSKLELIILLYQVYKKYMGENAESFDVFSKWGTTALSDFADVEQALVEPRTLFKDLRDIKEIENWSFNSAELSESQEKYLEFWNKLGGIYSAFREAQLNSEKYSYALLCNQLSKSEPAGAIPPQTKDIWFVGLSNLSKAEQKVIDKLANAGKCVIRWDGDYYYYEKEFHEAGHFLRHHAKKQDIVMGNDMLDHTKQFLVHETTTPYAQALLVRDLIQQIDPAKADQTAIIIADSTLLVPIIKNLPALDCKVNIALGYPLKQTAIMKLIKSLLQLHTPIPAREHRGIYFRHLLQVVEQQSLSRLLAEDIQKLRTQLIREVRVYLKPAELQAIFENFPGIQRIAYIFSEENRDPLTWVKNTMRLLAELERELEQEPETPNTEPRTPNPEPRTLNSSWQFELESIIRAQELLAEIPGIVVEGDEIAEMKSLQVIMQHLISGEAITFTGEPLEGLQILNMVETRALDFDHLIVVGANEDQLPGNLSDSSLIPFDVRLLYAMPTMADKEATYAYTLYRLLQRASHIDFLYSSITSEFKGTEQSRYITQIQLELADRGHQQIRFNHIKSALHDDHKEDLHVRIANDDFARQRIQQIWEAGISPSALNKFLLCPLDFYYRYILGLGEEEEMEEQISAATFGSAVHQVLEDFFKEYVGRFPSVADLQSFKEELGSLLKKAFEKSYGKTDLNYGENYLQFSLALKMLEKTVEFEINESIKRDQIGLTNSIAEIESTLEATIPQASTNMPFPLKIRGKADRIDHEMNVVRIIDYKTGAVKTDDVKIGKDGVSGAFEKKKGKIIQLLFYTYMEAQKGTPVEDIRAALFSLKNYSSGWQHIINNDSDRLTPEVLAHFEEAIVNCAKNMLAIEFFEHDSSSKHCEYCNR